MKLENYIGSDYHRALAKKVWDDNNAQIHDCPFCTMKLGKSNLKKHTDKCLKNPINFRYCKECKTQLFDVNKKDFCCRSCAAKFNNRNRTPESRKKQQETIQATYEKTPEQLYELETIRMYRHACDFKIPQDLEQHILGYGKIFSPINLDPNQRTLDHRYPIYEGYKNKLNPKILSHPANCEFLTRQENGNKSKSSSISLEQLLKEISIWNEKFPNKKWFNPITDQLTINFKDVRHTKKFNCPFCGSKKINDDCTTCNIKCSTQVLPNLYKYLGLKKENLGAPEFINDWNDCKNYAQSLYDTYTITQINEKFGSTHRFRDLLKYLGIKLRNRTEAIAFLKYLKSKV